jgi:antibiotic biosynthesis monooxygenase (ABM) superfamily enzyme
MYGTIVRFRLKPGMESELLRLDAEELALQIPGLLFDHVYRLDAGSNEYLIAVGFASKETYLANANSSEQHQRYLRWRELMEDDPEWHDGEIIGSFPPPR